MASATRFVASVSESRARAARRAAPTDADSRPATAIRMPADAPPNASAVGHEIESVTIALGSSGIPSQANKKMTVNHNKPTAITADAAHWIRLINRHHRGAVVGYGRLGYR